MRLSRRIAVGLDLSLLRGKKRERLGGTHFIANAEISGEMEN
jgi:hypothetical protein